MSVGKPVHRMVRGRMIGLSLPRDVDPEDNIGDSAADGVRATTRVISLNIQHGGGKRIEIILDWIYLRSPDVLVLSEWRDNAAGTQILSELVKDGYAASTLCDLGKNGLLIASRRPFTAERITPTGSERGELGLVEVNGLSICAVYFPQEKAKAPFFDVLFDLSRDLAEKPLLIIGDFNTGRDDIDREAGSVKFTHADRFVALESECGLIDLWRRHHGFEAREWSWRSSKNGFRIDHVFANKTAAKDVVKCTYFPETRSLGMSDHSALSVVIRNE
jgi:exodeoxyribonuclease III